MAETPVSRNEGSREQGASALLKRSLACAALAWAVPGAGHFWLGRRAHGLLFAGIVFAGILLGYYLDGQLYRPVSGQPLSGLGALAQLGFGLPYLVLLLSGASGDATAAGFEYGKAFFITAGLMNYLLVLDVWDITLGKKP